MIKKNFTVTTYVYSDAAALIPFPHPPQAPSCVYKYEFVLISLQVFFHGICAVPMVQEARFFLHPKMQITFRTVLLEAMLMCDGYTEITGYVRDNLTKGFLWHFAAPQLFSGCIQSD